jgi:predicted dehydrogenase
MNIGVIGVGSWGRRVLGEYADLSKEEIIDGFGFCDNNKELLKKYEKEYNPNIISYDYKDFLKNDDVDAVHICIPNKYHYEVAKEALTNGKHVLLEKPMTAKSDEAYRLIELASQNGLILQVGHIFRFANVIRRVKELFDEKYFGDIYYLSMNWTTLMNPMEGIDIVWDLLPHPLDMIHFLTGKWPSDWNITSRAFRREKLSEVAFMNLDYNSFFATIGLSWVTPERKRLLEVVGSSRSAKVECVKQNIHIFEGNENQFDLEVKSNNTIKEEAINFVNSIRENKMPFNSHIIGAKNVDVIEKIVKNI